MAVYSVQDVERFTPERYLVDGQVPAGAPVYLIGQMNWKVRARFRSSLSGLGARYVPPAEMGQALKAVIAEIAPANAEDFIIPIDAFLALPAKLPTPTASQSEEEATAQLEAIADRALVVTNYQSVVDQLSIHPAIGNLNRLLTLYGEFAPPLAAAYSLCGWENFKGDFSRLNGVVPDEVLEQLPFEDLVAIGAKALTMIQVSESQKGN